MDKEEMSGMQEEFFLDSETILLMMQGRSYEEAVKEAHELLQAEREWEKKYWEEDKCTPQP